MAKGVTAFSLLQAKAPFDVDNEALQGLIRATLEHNAKRVYYGCEVEDSSNIWIFEDWDDIEDHQRYLESSAITDAHTRLEPLINGPPGFVGHVSAEPYPPLATLDSSQSPVTEVLYIFFPSDISDEAKSRASERMAAFIDIGLKPSPDFRGASHGWSTERDLPIIGKAGQSGTMMLVFFGWTSVQSHMDNREAAHFKDNVHMVLDLEDIISLGMFHVSCKTKPLGG